MTEYEILEQVLQNQKDLKIVMRLFSVCFGFTLAMLLHLIRRG